MRSTLVTADNGDHQPDLAGLGEGDDRGVRTGAFSVRDDSGLAASFEDGDSEVVVPRSIPTARAMVVVLSFARPSPLRSGLRWSVVYVVPGSSERVKSDVLQL